MWILKISQIENKFLLCLLIKLYLDICKVKGPKTIITQSQEPLKFHCYPLPFRISVFRLITHQSHYTLHNNLITGFTSKICSHRDDAYVLQGCYIHVTRVLKGYYMDFRGLLWDCQRSVTRVSKECHTGVTRMLDGCYRGCIGMLQGWYIGVIGLLQ